MFGFTRVTQLFLAAAAALFLSGCLELFKDKNKSTQVSSVYVTNNSITITGVNLGEIKRLKVSGGEQDIELKIDSQSPYQIKAKAASALAFVAGVAYRLLLSTGNADVVVPITVQIAAGSLDPNVLKGAGASVGMVLKWNGTSWVPGNDETGAGGGVPAAGEFWLARHDGTLIGQILHGFGGNGTFLWDAQNGLAVPYTGPMNEQSGMRVSPGSLYFTTPDCTGQPYASLNYLAIGYIGNLAFRNAATIYKTESQVDNVRMFSFRNADTASTVLHPCSAVDLSGAFPRATIVTSFGLPLLIEWGSVKIIKR
jgi:hypothetical protein